MLDPRCTVSPLDFDSNAGQGADDTAVLQAWLDDPRPLKFLPPGRFRISGPLVLRRGNLRICGVGRRASMIYAINTGENEPFPMLTIHNPDELLEGVAIEQLGMHGGDFASGGLVWHRVHFSSVREVEIRRVAGSGVELTGVQDSEFHGLDVRHCGRYDEPSPESSLPAVLMRHDAACDFDTNSLAFFGGDLERNHHHACVIDGAYAVRFLGMKFHGRLLGTEQGEDPAPRAIDLLQLVGARRVTVTACQFAHARRNAITLLSAGRQRASAAITGNTFQQTANYADGPAWNVRAEQARVVIEGNYFAEGSHPSYTRDGGDISLDPGVQSEIGANLHHGHAGQKVRGAGARAA